ncbi:TM2 domain-containing membrane protein YozV [Mycolicibacterium fluoranthenivorans]|uniref:TM2 domain-containing membrane protein YozV n=1 Tax=Mycolicibacterium fluoranthenivorans TaxID=258505 RepID=A0A7X5U3G4_9MYCO|nr:TM2 domain-containing protein [Mycolicibacterium fluoranthenivorans]NIH97650.1 TM2 domain-containing membrane protein YozV [Mycolicibacterium fluoranthenivorans]
MTTTPQPQQDPTYAPQPAHPGVDPLTGRPLSDKSKVTAGLLGILLGSFGLGRFYLGYTKLAVAQIAVTWLTLGIGGIWPFIDGILILLGKVPDVEGRPLRS